MSISTLTSITIDNQPLLKFNRLVIEQKVNGHHKFSIVHHVSYDLLSSALEKAKSYIGAKVLITTKPVQFGTGNELQFRGLVSEVKLLRANGSAGGILINGFSPTFQMEGLPDTMSFNDQSVKEIAEQIISRYPSDRLEPQIDIESDETNPFVVQYKESDFQFLSRIAQKKGLWFYYNGRELVLGKPKSKNITLKYGENLSSFNLELRTKPVNFNFMGYDPASASNGSVSSNSVQYSSNSLGEFLFEHSKKFYPTEAQLLYNNPINEGSIDDHLNKRTETQLLSQSSDLLTLTGNSDVPNIRIGDVVEVVDPGFSVNSLDVLKIQEQNYGKYIITDILHVCDEAGNYSNEFQGVTADSALPPYGNVHNIPLAETQPAVVVDNNDPAGIGRVQVQFPWQQRNNSITPWIRLIQPHSGGGKGFYFVPEIGEEVLVGFESGNAEKPYVMGTQYNGAATSGYADSGNNIKAIHTRSGHIVKFTEDESIIITDKSGNEIHLDTSGSNINITAPETMNLNCKNLNINVGENMTTSVGMNNTEAVGAVKTTSVTGDANLFITGKLMEMIEGDVYSESKQNRQEIAQEDMQFQSAKNIDNHSQTVVTNNSGEMGTNH
jgi:type VI secretion system secreted protein VgrG